MANRRQTQPPPPTHRLQRNRGEARLKAPASGVPEGAAPETRFRGLETKQERHTSLLVLCGKAFEEKAAADTANCDRVCFFNLLLEQKQTASRMTYH